MSLFILECLHILVFVVWSSLFSLLIISDTILDLLYVVFFISVTLEPLPVIYVLLDLNWCLCTYSWSLPYRWTGIIGPNPYVPLVLSHLWRYWLVWLFRMLFHTWMPLLEWLVSHCTNLNCQCHFHMFFITPYVTQDFLPSSVGYVHISLVVYSTLYIIRVHVNPCCLYIAYFYVLCPLIVCIAVWLHKISLSCLYLLNFYQLFSHSSYVICFHFIGVDELLQGC